MPISLKRAKELAVGTIVHHDTLKNADGTALRLKVNGEVKTWKTMPDRIKIPFKHGLYEFGYITNKTDEGALNVDIADVHMRRDD